VIKLKVIHGMKLGEGGETSTCKMDGKVVGCHKKSMHYLIQNPQYTHELRVHIGDFSYPGPNVSFLTG